MKRIALFLTLLLLGVSATTTLASGPENGFFLGGGAHVRWVPATGTWNGQDFDAQEPLGEEEQPTIGFSWTDKFLLGVKPMVGYRVNPYFAFQASYDLNIPKSSQQVSSTSTVDSYYEQGLQLEWRQRSIELVGVFHPGGGHGDFFVFAGVDLMRLTVDATLYEGLESNDIFGNLTSIGEVQNFTDHSTTTGLIIGAGLDFPSSSELTEVFIHAQYSTARTRGAFFGTEDFEVDVGGVTVTVGMRLYPF
jgi:hypothetical protein